MNDKKWPTMGRTVIMWPDVSLSGSRRQTAGAGAATLACAGAYCGCGASLIGRTVQVILTPDDPFTDSSPQ